MRPKSNLTHAWVRVFVHDMPFHSSLRDPTKARTYPSGAHVRQASLDLAPGLTHKYFTRLKIFSRDKHSSLFCLLAVAKKKGYCNDTCSHCYKTFFFVTCND